MTPSGRDVFAGPRPKQRRQTTPLLVASGNHTDARRAAVLPAAALRGGGREGGRKRMLGVDGPDSEIPEEKTFPAPVHLLERIVHFE